MKIKKGYFNHNGKHQEVVYYLFSLIISPLEKSIDDDTNKNLKKFKKLLAFYVDFYYFLDVYNCGLKGRIDSPYIFGLAVYSAKKSSDYKGKCESLSHLERKIDRLILKAYSEQIKNLQEKKLKKV